MLQVTYEYRHDLNNSSNAYPKGNQVGWIAQEMEEIVPEVVMTNPDTGLKSIAYSHVTPLVVEAIKAMKEEHDEEIKSMKAKYDEEISTLQQSVNDLKQMVQQLLLLQQQKTN